MISLYFHVGDNDVVTKSAKNTENEVPGHPSNEVTTEEPQWLTVEVNVDYQTFGETGEFHFLDEQVAATLCFESEDDQNHALRDSLWVIVDHYLFVRHWKPISGQER